MMGTPIAAAHSYITKPISNFVDELIKPTIHQLTVVWDSGELSQLLENTLLPNSSCFLVTGMLHLYIPTYTPKRL